MKNKSAHKHSTSHKSKSSSEQTVLWYTVIIFSLILMVFANVGYKLTKPHVLGASTVFLAQAQGGMGGGERDNGGQENSGPTNEKGRNQQGTMQNPGQTENTGIGSGNTVENNTPVDCVGPDDKHLTSSFKDCKTLNSAWDKSNFTFTPLSGSQAKEDMPDASQASELQPSRVPHSTGSMEVKTTGKSQLNLNKPGTQVEISQDGNSVAVTAITQDGKQHVLNSQDALQKLNSQLGNEDIHIGTADGGFKIAQGNVEAQTNLPISIDPTTNQLSVTTPNGTQDVAVLPDQAVQNLLKTNVLSGVTSQSLTNSQSGATQQVQLTEINNEAAFKVDGVLTKKLFGMFPVSYSKTAYVSAQDGHTIQVEQPPLTRFLETLSF